VDGGACGTGFVTERSSRSIDLPSGVPPPSCRTITRTPATCVNDRRSSAGFARAILSWGEAGPERTTRSARSVGRGARPPSEDLPRDFTDEVPELGEQELVEGEPARVGRAGQRDDDAARVDPIWARESIDAAPISSKDRSDHSSNWERGTLL